MDFQQSYFLSYPNHFPHIRLRDWLLFRRPAQIPFNLDGYIRGRLCSDAFQRFEPVCILHYCCKVRNRLYPVCFQDIKLFETEAYDKAHFFIWGRIETAGFLWVVFTDGFLVTYPLKVSASPGFPTIVP